LHDVRGGKVAARTDRPLITRDLSVRQAKEVDAHLAEVAVTQVGDGLRGAQAREADIDDGEGVVGAELQNRGAGRGRAGDPGWYAQAGGVQGARVVEDGGGGGGARRHGVGGAAGEGDRGGLVRRDADTDVLGQRLQVQRSGGGAGRHGDGGRQGLVVDALEGRAADLEVHGQRSRGGAGAGDGEHGGLRTQRVRRRDGGGDGDGRRICGGDVVELDQREPSRVGRAADLHAVAAGREIHNQRGVAGTTGKGEGAGPAGGGRDGGGAAGAPVVIAGHLQIACAQHGDGRIGEHPRQPEGREGGAGRTNEKFS
jgi:hypothetical protein